MAGLVLLATGSLAIFKPEVAWKFKEGWKFRDAEPSDQWLEVCQLTGLVQILAGLFLMVAGKYIM